MNIRESGARRTFVMAALLGAREMHVSAVQCAPRFSDPKVWHVCAATDAHLPRDLATSAPGLGHACTETDAPLHQKGTRPHLHRDRCTSAPRPMHVCTETDVLPGPGHVRYNAEVTRANETLLDNYLLGDMTNNNSTPKQTKQTKQTTKRQQAKPSKPNKPNNQPNDNKPNQANKPIKPHKPNSQPNDNKTSKQTKQTSKRLRSEANQTTHQTTTMRSKQSSEQANQASSFGIGGCLREPSHDGAPWAGTPRALAPGAAP